MQNGKLLVFVALGLVGGVASVTVAQPYLVNGSGATLQEAFFNAPASTNDYIDVDNDGLIAIDGDQLAPFDSSFPWNVDQQWQVTYRVVGSGNGFAEMRDWGIAWATAVDGDPANGTLASGFADSAIWNRDEFVHAGVTQGQANVLNPGATPVRSLMDGTYAVTTSTDPLVGGMQMDFSALDVPVSWFTTQSGTAQYNRVPGAPGYGDNPRLAVNKDGTDTTRTNKLKSLIGLNGTLNTNITNPDANTVYDTPISLTPVAAIVNFGVGLEQIDVSDLRHTAATGRRINGENLMVVTRDSGSGTRNAFMNGICLDPSWGVGENIGERTVSTVNDLIGPNYQPSNKGGSSRMEATVINHRLGMGHTGAERGESKGWLTGGKMELLAVRADLKGGTVYARPTLGNVLNGGIDGYNITGPATIATIGDARSDDPSVGGWGWDPSETGGYPKPIQPPRNPQISAYMNNITRSISAFVALPGSDETLFTPGEFLATQFMLVAAAEFVPETNPDSNETCIPLIPNPDYNGALHDFIRDESGNVLGLSVFATFNQSSAGLVPTRTTGIAYSDASATGGSATGQHYVDQAGNTVSYGAALSMRNKICGDFNNDGTRSAADVADMIAAWNARNGGPAWAAGTDAVIEVLGDYNGDGNFDAEDVRYWADGLHVVAGQLDRAAGYTAVDVASGGNFFGTTKSTGAVYAPGDSRADVANDTGLATRGFAPTADGTIDAHDINYVKAQFVNNSFVTDGEATWSDLAEAVGFDLSCDINGDMVVDTNDIDAIYTILGTCIADHNLNGTVNSNDFVAYLNDYTVANPNADVNYDGTVNSLDFIAYLNAFVAGC